MNNGVYHQPTVFHFGAGTEAGVGREAGRFAKRVLLHYGRGSIKRNGVYDGVRRSLIDAGLEVHELAGVESNPRADLVYRGIDLCRQHGIGFVLAVGGGSVIDSAKAICVGVPYGGDFFDLFRGDAAPDAALKLGVVLTIPGSGSESSAAAVVTRGAQKYVCDTPLLLPAFAVLNPEFSRTVPPFETASGIVDAMSHVFERYFTNTEHVDCTDRICEGLLLTLMDAAWAVLADPGSYGVRAEIMWACKLAHDQTPGFGRKQDWGCHKIGHEIGALFDVSHGAIMGVVFLAWFKLIAARNARKLIQLGSRVFGVDTAIAAIAAFERFLISIGMPTSLRALAVEARSEFRTIANGAVRRQASGTIGNYVRLSPDDIVSLLEIAH